MDKRVQIIKENIFKIDCREFLDINIYKDKTDYERYKYVLNNYYLLNIKPTFKQGKKETLFTIIFESGDTYCQHCFRAIKTTTHNKEDKARGTKARDMETIDIFFER